MPSMTIELDPSEGEFLHIHVKGHGPVYTIEVFEEGNGDTSLTVRSEINDDYIDQDTLPKEAK